MNAIICPQSQYQSEYDNLEMRSQLRRAEIERLREEYCEAIETALANVTIKLGGVDFPALDVFDGDVEIRAAEQAELDARVEPS